MPPTSGRPETQSRHSLSKAWSVEIMDERNVRVTPPSAHSFTVENGSIAWDRTFTSPTASDLLWLHSLHFLPYLSLNEMGALSEEIALDYQSNLLSGHFEEHKAILRSSWDHATAMRLESISELISISERNDSKSSLLDLLEVDLAWALDSSNMQMNNHGLMLAIGLLQAAAVLRATNPNRAARIEQYAGDSISFIVRTVFGFDGYCNENSPFYAHFYVLKLRELKTLYASSLSEAGLSAMVDDALETALRTLGNVILPSGYIPPLGDSSYMDSPYTSNLGTFISQRTGFWVHKTKSIYLSLKCGSESSVHKHVDDSSLTLQYEGCDFFVDSGYHSYDYSDPRVAMLRTQRGHSGLYFKEVDDILPGLLFNYRKRIQASIAPLGCETGKAVSSHYSLDCEHSAQRRIEVFDGPHIRITDSAHSALGWVPLQRFIIPSEASIVIGPDRVTISNGNRRLTMMVPYEHIAEVVTAQRSAPHKGWRSVDPLKLIPVQCLEIFPRDPSGPWVLDLHID